MSFLKLLAQTIATGLVAIVPSALMAIAIISKAGIEHYWALCVFGGLAMFPIAFTSLYFSSALARFFVSTWGDPYANGGNQ
jgi:hypothetical protein